jgi:hypothetical protein
VAVLTTEPFVLRAVRRYLHPSVWQYPVSATARHHQSAALSLYARSGRSRIEDRATTRTDDGVVVIADDSGRYRPIAAHPVLS